MYGNIMIDAPPAGRPARARGLPDVPSAGEKRTASHQCSAGAHVLSISVLRFTISEGLTRAEY